MTWPTTCAKPLDPVNSGVTVIPFNRVLGVLQQPSSMDKPSKIAVRKVTRPAASSDTVRNRMRATPQRDTPAELRIRQALHAMGLRYSIDTKPLVNSPRRADIVFRRAKVAVFVDGCFWHGCPEHGTWPKANRRFWREKILSNRERDLDTNDRLQKSDWLVIRIWEHEDPSIAAARIAHAVRSRSPANARPRKSIP